MRKWVTLALLCCLMLAAAACGGGTNNGTDANGTGNATANANGNAGGSANQPSEQPQTDQPQSAEPQAEEISGKIRMSTFRTDIVDTKFPEWAKQFQEKYPKVEITFDAYTDYAKDIKVQMASNDYADVLMNPGIPQAELDQYFIPLDDLGYNDKILFKEMGLGKDGKMYQINSAGIAYLVTYDKRVFARAGITELPKTWDEFLAVCEKLKALGDVTPLATNFKDSWPVMPWFMSQGIIDKDPNLFDTMAKTDTPWTTDKAFGQFHDKFMDLKNKGYLDKDLNSTNWMGTFPDMGAGKIGMVWLGNYMTGNAVNYGNGKAEDYGYFAMPLDNSGVNSIIMGPDWWYVINKNSKNIPAAKAWLKFLLDSGVYNDYTATISPIKGAPNADPELQKFLETNPPIYEQPAAGDDYNNIVNKSQIDMWKMTQEYLIADDLQAAMDKYNKKWADARKALGIQ